MNGMSRCTMFRLIAILVGSLLSLCGGSELAAEPALSDLTTRQALV